MANRKRDKLRALLRGQSTQSPQASPEPTQKLTKARLTWDGIRLLISKLESSLDGTPAKGPIAALNAVIEIAEVRSLDGFGTSAGRT